MAVNKPIIAAEQASRPKVKHTAVRITNTVPPDAAFWTNPDTGQNETVSQQPQREGQMVIYREPGSSDVQMLVVIDIGGELQWKYVLTQPEILNNGTGRTWDPNAHFYTNLAP